MCKLYSLDIIPGPEDGTTWQVLPDDEGGTLRTGSWAYDWLLCRKNIAQRRWKFAEAGSGLCRCYSGGIFTWWRHQMKIFSALLSLCAENSPVTGEFPAQRPVTRSFDVFFDLSLNERLSKQSRRRWLRSLWRYSNVIMSFDDWDI